MVKAVFRQLSSLEKVFPGKEPEADEQLSASIMLNERFSYQIAYKTDAAGKTPVKISVKSPLAEFIKIRRIELVPVNMPFFSHNHDDDYIMKEPGLAPDALMPLRDGREYLRAHGWYGFWVTVDPAGRAPAGKYDIDTVFEWDGSGTRCRMALEIIDAALPPQELIYTNWLHTDCLAKYYDVPVFSEEYWKITESFIKTAAENGINMILTPLFTPPLDTKIGGERPTVQLIGVKHKNGRYDFDFSLLDRWTDMCRRCGIKYFEISHLFTQWGGKATPKIIADTEDGEKRIFGWDVSSDAYEYKDFLDAFLPELTKYLKARGIAEKTYFHISDEPSGEDGKAAYSRCKAMISRHLEGFKIIDALSEPEFYKERIVEHPVATTDSAKRFIDAGAEDLWVYYCCAQGKAVSNRFIAMPSRRTRCIAEQLFKYGIKGFLHWGYNFYFSQNSEWEIDPFAVTDADGAFPSGDAFSVYPGADGRPAESLRIAVFHDALQDMRAMELLARYEGRESVVRLLEDEAGQEIEFCRCPKDTAYIIRRREAINRRIAGYIK